MAFTVSNLRTLLQDPAGSSQQLTDDDYALLLQLEPNLFLAASMAATMIAERYALKVDTDVKGAAIKNSQKRDAWLKIAYKWEKRAADGSGTETGDDIGVSGIPAPIMTGVSKADMRANKKNQDMWPEQFSIGRDDNEPSTYRDDEAQVPDPFGSI